MRALNLLAVANYGLLGGETSNMAGEVHNLLTSVTRRSAVILR